MSIKERNLGFRADEITQSHLIELTDYLQVTKSEALRKAIKLTKKFIDIERKGGKVITRRGNTVTELVLVD